MAHSAFAIRSTRLSSFRRGRDDDCGSGSRRRVSNGNLTPRNRQPSPPCVASFTFWDDYRYPQRLKRAVAPSLPAKLRCRRKLSTAMTKRAPEAPAPRIEAESHAATARPRRRRNDGQHAPRHDRTHAG